MHRTELRVMYCTQVQTNISSSTLDMHQTNNKKYRSQANSNKTRILLLQ